MATANVPTLAEIQETKINMDTINEFINSTSPTLVDQYGTTRKTPFGIETSLNKLLSGVSELFVSSTPAGVIEIDTNLYNVVKIPALTSITGIDFINVPSGPVYTCSIFATSAGAGIIDWGAITANGFPATIVWQGGVAPVDTVTGETDIFILVTFNGGTTWFGSVSQGYV